MTRRFTVGLLLACVLLSTVTLRAGDVAEEADKEIAVDRTVRLVVKPNGAPAVAGKVVSYNLTSLTLADAKDVRHTIAWTDLPAQRVVEVHQALIGNWGQRWFDLGVILTQRGDAGAAADQAFARAVTSDPAFKEKVQTFKSVTNAPTTAPANPTRPAPGMTAPVKTNPWPILTDERQTELVAQEKQMLAEGFKARNLKLVMFETKYFLFYSNLGTPEMTRWAGVLDEMYRRLSDIFAVEKGRNIWYGKAVVVIFAKREQFLEYELKVHHNTPHEGVIGLCHTSSAGPVVISFFRQSDENLFAEVLVHESTHGFLHRYRSPVPVPSWANEGLAELIPSEQLNKAMLSTGRMNRAKATLAEHDNSLGNLFQLEHINDWQYGIASNLTRFMIQSNKKKYVLFINSIKDGIPPEEALKKSYGVDYRGLTAVYAQSLGIRNLVMESR